LESKEGLMPTFAYRCTKCEATFERVETMSDYAVAKPHCPECGSDQVVWVPAPFTAITGKKS
jgi:putative FmdB family regulatory protein